MEVKRKRNKKYLVIIEDFDTFQFSTEESRRFFINALEGYNWFVTKIGEDEKYRKFKTAEIEE